MNLIHYQVFGPFIYDAIEVTYVMNAQIICVFEKTFSAVSYLA